METLYTHVYRSPVGPIHLIVDRNGVVHRIGYAPTSVDGDYQLRTNKYACGELEKQLDEYFAGQRVTFSVDVTFVGTEFQQSVWSRMRKIGYGTTMTYGTLAQKVGRREAAQAVGNAVAVNPIAIVIPCHRIVSASGDIGQYARRSVEPERGRDIKRFLLELERAV